MISKTEISNHYPVKIGIEYHEKNSYGYKEEFPYKLILDFGDYPILIKRSKSEETLQKEFAKIIKKSKLFQNNKFSDYELGEVKNVTKELKETYQTEV